jgi:hypothetical protein
VSTSRTLDVTQFVIHIFRMTLFFIIAGYFARLGFHRKGWVGFVWDRAKRIGLPLVIAWILILPLMFAVMTWASTQPGVQGFRIPTEAPASGVPLIHLWFLYLLLWLYALTIMMRGLFVLLDRSGALRAIIDSRLRYLLSMCAAPAVLAMPLATSLYLADWWFMKIGIPTPERGLIPNVPAVVGYGVAFQFGWAMQRQASALEILRDRAWVYFLSGVVFTVIAWFMAEPLPRYAVAETSLLFRALYATLYPIAGWCWSLGIIGLTVRYLSQPNSAVRFVADASYWLYLAHLPLVYALQVFVMNWPIHWSIKFPMIVTTTLLILLASYQYLVRGTFIGAALNGARRTVPRA